MSSAPYMVNGLAMPPPPSPQQPQKESPSPQKAVSKSPAAHMVGGLTMPPPPVDPTPSGPRMVGGLSMPPLSAADSGPRMVGGLTMPPLSAADSGPRMVGGLTMPPLSAAITGPSTSQQPSPPVSQSPEPKPISPAPEAAPKRRGRPPKPENQRRAPRISPYTDEDLAQRRGRKALRTYWFTGATHKDRQNAIDVYTGGNKYDWMKNTPTPEPSPRVRVPDVEESTPAAEIEWLGDGEPASAPLSARMQNVQRRKAKRQAKKAKIAAERK